MAVFGSSSSSIWGSVLMSWNNNETMSYFQKKKLIIIRKEQSCFCELKAPPWLLNECLHLFSNLSVVLVDEPEQELALREENDDDCHFLGNFDDFLWSWWWWWWVLNMTNLLCKSIVDSVFYVTASPRKISGQELPSLAEFAEVWSSALLSTLVHKSH